MRALYSHPEAERMVLARQHRGELVRLVFSPSRDVDGHVYVGVLLAVARTLSGGSAGTAVLRTERGEELAFSLATVRSIEKVRP